MDEAELPPVAALLPVEGVERDAELVPAEPALDEPEVAELLFVAPLDDPELADPPPPLLDAPVFGAGFAFALEVLPDVPGIVPQGEAPDVDPGVFGFMVEGCVVLPGVGGVGEVAPGTVDGVVGVAVLPDGVAVPPGGVAAVPPVCAPVLPAAPPAGAPAPAAAPCATAQLAQARKSANIVILAVDIGNASCF